MRKLLLALAVLTATGTGCNYYLRPNQLPPVVSQVAPEQRLATWNRAIGVLLDEGYVPNELDATACFIRAQMRDDVQVGKLQGTLALVTVGPDGRVRVAVSGHGQYTSADGLLKDLTDEQNKLASEIMQSAPTAPPAAAPAAGATPSS